MNINELTKSYINALSGIIEVETIYSGRHEILIRGNPIKPEGFGDFEIKSRLVGLPGEVEILNVTPKVVIRLKPSDNATRSNRLPVTNMILFVRIEQEMFFVSTLKE